MKPWLKSAGMVVLFVLFGISILAIVHLSRTWQNPARVPIVAITNLLIFSNSSATASFVCPLATRFSLVIGCPPGQSPPDGQLKISTAGKEILSLGVSTNTLVKCNWLDRHSLDGYIVANVNSADAWDLSSFLSSGMTYTLDVQPHSGNSNQGSVWLHYIRPSGWK